MTIDLLTEMPQITREIGLSAADLPEVTDEDTVVLVDQDEPTVLEKVQMKRNRAVFR
jgi:hypothetical protein